MFAVDGHPFSPASFPTDSQHPATHRKVWSQKAGEVAVPACGPIGLSSYFCLLCFPTVHKL